MSVLVSASFDNADRAKQAVEDLVEGSFPSDDISVLMRQDGHVEEVPLRHKTLVPQGAAMGAALGGLAGLTLIPGLGLLAVGPVVGMLQGATWGTIAGALGGLAWWKDEADFPTESLEKGGVLVGVMVPDGRADEAANLLRRAGANKQWSRPGPVAVPE